MRAIEIYSESKGRMGTERIVRKNGELYIEWTVASFGGGEKGKVKLEEAINDREILIMDFSNLLEKTLQNTDLTPEEHRQVERMKEETKNAIPQEWKD